MLRIPMVDSAAARGVMNESELWLVRQGLPTGSPADHDPWGTTSSLVPPARRRGWRAYPEQGNGARFRRARILGEAQDCHTARIAPEKRAQAPGRR